MGTRGVIRALVCMRAGPLSARSRRQGGSSLPADLAPGRAAFQCAIAEAVQAQRSRMSYRKGPPCTNRLHEGQGTTRIMRLDDFPCSLFKFKRLWKLSTLQGRRRLTAAVLVRPRVVPPP